MSTVPPAVRDLARQWLARGGPADGAAAAGEGDAARAARACAALRGPLARLAGAAGFASLLSRALVLATRQSPGLAGLAVAADGTLEGPDAPGSDGAARDGGLALLSELLGLLVTVIGEPLTLSLVREAWPDAPAPAPAPASGTPPRTRSRTEETP